jgi:TetR/AcrR family transcriptional regulator, repressor for uid operon
VFFPFLTQNEWKFVLRNNGRVVPKLKPDTQTARREHILDAAEECFARTGFHRTTIQDICREADVSLGSVYVYFKSKEDLIEGISQRDRAKLAAQLADVGQDTDLLSALGRLAQHYLVDEPRLKQQLVVEIGCQSMRSEPVGEIFRSCDAFVLDQFEQLFSRAQAEGKIAPALDHKILAQTISVLGDGLFWRRAVHPGFDAQAMMPVITAIIAGLLAPTPSASSDLNPLAPQHTYHPPNLAGSPPAPTEVDP